MTRLLLILLLPLTMIPAAAPQKKYTKAHLHTIKEELEYQKFLHKIQAPQKKKKKLKQYKGPRNSPKLMPINSPYPEIVIEFVALDEVKK